MSTALCCVILLYVFADLPNKKKNGFNRVFLDKVPLMPNIDIRLPFEAKGIGGKYRNEILLTTNSARQMWFLKKSNQLYHRKLYIDKGLEARIKNIFKVQTINDTCFLTAGNIPLIVEIHFSKNKYSSIYLSKPAINANLYVRNRKFVLRRYNPAINDMVFTQFDHSRHRFEKTVIIPPVHHDGGVLTDGQLHYDSTSDLIIYVHYYDNHLTLFDRNLKNIKFFTTIDTISVPKHKTDRKNKIQTPPLPINQASYTSNGLLFICSNLKADNESADLYFSNIPIDVYDIIEQQYIGTFYIESVKQALPKSIFTHGNEIVVLFHQNILRSYSIEKLSQLNGHI